MPWVDLLLAGLLLLSVIVGVVRGFVFEVMSLLGWVVAYFLASVFGADLAPHIPIGAAGSSLRGMAAFVAVFVAALLVWALLSRLMRLLVQATPLSAFDRLLGALFGCLRGGLILLLIALVVNATPAARSPAWKQAQLVPWLDAGLAALKPVIAPPFNGKRPFSVGPFRSDR